MLVLLISTLVVAQKRERLLPIGLIYIGAVFLTYFLFGLGLISFMATIPQVIAQYISIFVGMLVIAAGILEIKDYFWYGSGFSLMIPKKYADSLQKRMENLSVGTVLFLGIFVASVELPCTGGPYLAITTLLAQQFDLTALLLLVLYNLIFVLPLVIILVLVAVGVTKVQDIQSWKQSNKGYMRLATGVLLIVLGFLLMLIANGTINLN